MQPYAIYCTTCKARLRVADPSLVGQILACPKCESMVLVELPPAGAPEMVVANETAGAGSSPPAAPGIATAVTPPPLPAAAPSLASSSGDPVHVQTIGPTMDGNPIIEPVRPPDWKLFAGGIAVGAILGASVWLLVAMRNTEGDAVVASSTKTLPMEAESAPGAIAEQPASERSSAAAPENVESVEALKPVAEIPTAEAEVTAKPEDAPPEMIEAEPPEVAANAEPDLVQPVIEPPRQQPEADTVEAWKEAAAPIEKAEPAPTEKVAVAKSITTDPQLAELGVRLPKVAFDKVPLRQFATFAAEASGSKIEIDYRSLKAAGFKAPTITARATDCTLGQLLHDSLEEIGLTFESRNGSIVIFAP